MKRFFTSLVLVLATVAAMAQGKMNFANETYDFAEVVEGVLASHEFEFVNTGNQPVIIQNVQASCGCTTPFWTRDPIAPGKKGFVKASYNSNGRPGPFTKTITVTSNAEEATLILTIKGKVIEKGKMPTVTEEMKKNSATIEFVKSETNLGRLEVGQPATARFQFKNTGKSNLEVVDVSVATYTIKWNVSQSSIKPGESGTLEITYTPTRKGEVTEQVSVASTDYNNFYSTLKLKATVVDASTTGSMMKQGGGTPFR